MSLTANQLTDILDSAIAAISCFQVFPNQDWEYLYCSAGCEAILGFSAAEVMADKSLWRSRLWPEDQETIIPVVMANILAGQNSTVEYRIQHQDGSWHWITETYSARWQQTAAAWRVTAVAQPISDRRQPASKIRDVERDMQTSETHYQGIVEDQTELICHYLSDGTLTYVNPAYCRYFNHSFAELVGHPFTRLMLAEDVCRFQANLASLSCENPTVTAEYRAILETGEIRNHLWTDRAICNPQGEIIEYQAVGIALDKTQTLFEEIFNSAFQFMGLITAEGRFINVNQTAVTFIGCDSDTIANQFIWETPWFIDLPAVQAQLREGVQTASRGELYRFQAQVRGVDGTILDLDASLKPLINEAGQVYQILVEGRDISDRQAAERSLKQAYRQINSLIENMPLVLRHDYKLGLASVFRSAKLYKA